MSSQEIDKDRGKKCTGKIDRLVSASLSIGRCRQGAGRPSRMVLFFHRPL